MKTSDLQNITQKTKDRATRTPLKIWVKKQAVPAPMWQRS